MPTKRPCPAVRGVLPVLCILFIPAAMLCSAMTESCSPAQKRAESAGVGDLGACIIGSDGQTPEQILKDCAGTTIVDIEKILTAQRKRPACSGTSPAYAPILDAGAARDVSYGPGK